LAIKDSKRAIYLTSCNCNISDKKVKSEVVMGVLLTVTRPHASLIAFWCFWSRQLFGLHVGSIGRSSESDRGDVGKPWSREV